jgi:hypothetical protein
MDIMAVLEIFLAPTRYMTGIENVPQEKKDTPRSVSEEKDRQWRQQCR